MATTESNLIRITALETQVAELLSKSVLPSEMTSAQRKSVTDALYPEGVALQYDNPDVLAGDLVYGKDASGFFFGRADIDSPSSRADITMELEL